MRKTMIVLSVLVAMSMLLAACGGGAPAAVTDTPAPVEAAATDTPAPADQPTAVPPTPTTTPYPVADCQAGKTCVRWFVGLGTGTDPVQITVQEDVVKDFNAS